MTDLDLYRGNHCAMIACEMLRPFDALHTLFINTALAATSVDSFLEVATHLRALRPLWQLT